MTAVPYVPKQSVTVIALDDPLEANALRAILEGFDFRVSLHWVGSRDELMRMLAGTIPTDDTVILSCHGDQDEILVPNEPAIRPDDVRDQANLNGKTWISLGCLTGSPTFVEAYKAAGVTHYIAPVDYPYGRAATAFVSSLFFLLATGTDLSEAVDQTAAFHEELNQFRLLH